MATTFAVPDGRVAMAATTYTGTGATLAVSNAVNTVSFQPDFVWVKDRTVAYGNVFFDVIRGVSKYVVSNSTATEVTDANSLSAFTSTGFSVGTSVVSNTNADAYVGWNWKAGGAVSAGNNTAGTITSTVSANTTAGFSVVTYTGTGATGTVGHGLGVAPAFVIIKSRSNVDNWYAYHSTIGNTGAIFLNLVTATTTNSGYWNNTSPTASVFSIGATPSQSAWTYVAYCWASVAGYSAFGSYVGNGSTDGPFIYTGFRPRFILIKATTAPNNWAVIDSSRNPANVAMNQLYANLTDTEYTAYIFGDLNSNGVKIRGNTTLSDNYNTSGTTYIYAAFAENPLKYANAR
jgi:hypothetical protein